MRKAGLERRDPTKLSDIHRPASETIARAVLFIRVNRGGVGSPAVADSHIERDRSIGHATAAQLGAVVVREYVDTGGGISLERRPELQTMLDDLTTAADIDYVITRDWARLTRRHEDMLLIAQRIEDAGAQIIEGTQDFEHQVRGYEPRTNIVEGVRHMLTNNNGDNDV